MEEKESDTVTEEEPLKGSLGEVEEDEPAESQPISEDKSDEGQDFNIDEDEIRYNEEDETEDEVTVFVCPICESEVEEDMDKCSSCGAVFVEEEEETEIHEGKDEEVERSVEESEEEKSKDTGEIDDLLETLEEDTSEEKPAKDTTTDQGEKEKKLEETLSFLEEEEEVEEESEEEVDDIDQALEELEEVAFEDNGAKPEIKDQEIDEEVERKRELEERLNNTEDRLSRFEDEEISPQTAEELLEESRKAIDSSDFNTAETKIQRSIEFADEAEEFLKRLEETKNELEDFKNKIRNTGSLRQRIAEAKKRLEEGRSGEAIEELEKIASDIEKKKKKYQTTSEKKEDINKMISQLDTILDAGDKIDLTLKRERKLISKALVASKNDNIDKAVDWLTQAHKHSRKEIEDKLSSKIETLKDKVIGSKRLEKTEIKDMLTRLEDAKMSREYDRAAELLIELKDLVSGKEELEDERFSSLKGYIDKADELGVDVSEGKDMLEEALEAREKKEENDIELHLELARKELKKRLPKALQKIMKNGLGQLEEAKENGKDISRAVTHLKRANLMIKKNKYFKALDQMYSFNENIETDEEEEENKSQETVKVKKQTKGEKAEDEKKTIKIDRNKDRSSGQKRKRTGKNTRGEIPTDLESGSTYLFVEKKPEISHKTFSELLDKDPRRSGLCITRRYPDKVKKKYDLGSEVSVLWLSDIDQEDALKAENLERLSLEIEKFLSEGEELVLFDDLEYLISKNGFKTVFNLLQSFKDQAAVSNSIMLVTVSPNTFEKNQIDLLEKEVDETYHG